MVPLLFHSPRMSSSDSEHTVGTFFTLKMVTSERTAPCDARFSPADSVARDYDSIEKAIIEAKKSTDSPTMINLKTRIGFGSTQAGTHGVHGSREIIHRESLKSR